MQGTFIRSITNLKYCKKEIATEFIGLISKYVHFCHGILNLRAIATLRPIETKDQHHYLGTLFKSDIQIRHHWKTYICLLPHYRVLRVTVCLNLNQKGKRSKNLCCCSVDYRFLDYMFRHVWPIHSNLWYVSTCFNVQIIMEWFPRRKTNYSNFEFIFENCLLVQKIDCRSRSVRILINSKRPVNCSKRTRITRAHNEKNITALWHSTPNSLGCVLLTSNAIKPRVQLFEGRLYSAILIRESFCFVQKHFME